jgi:aminoacyl-tRNA hydrolase
MQLRRVIFIGVTGSCGKTTTRNLIAAVLARQFQGRQNHGNLLSGIAKTILNVRPWDDFCVLEIAAGQRRALERPLRLARPQIGVVTNIGMDHISAFESIEAIVEEKGKLIAALSETGTAILNADDHRVMDMQARCKGRILTYGLDENAMVRATDIQSNWPDRLSFTVHYEEQSRKIQTQLCGTHWVSCALAAIAVGLEMNVSFDEIAHALESLPPFTARLSPRALSNGVTIIRDDYKAPLWTIPASLQVIKDAKAKRRIIVVGTISDYQGSSSPKYVNVAKKAIDSADYVFFVGPWASRCLRARQYPDATSLRAFTDVDAIIPFLKDFLEPEDLVLLKGSDATDHLANIIPALEDHSLQDNRERNRDQQTVAAKSAPEDSESKTQFVVGLGNPGDRFEGTPHNIGQRVLDVLVEKLGGEWAEDSNAIMAKVEWRGKPVCLVKLTSSINVTGQALNRLSKKVGMQPTDLILVQDDINLPIGAIRTRHKGGAGGHKGIESIVNAFQSEAIRRVKVGVGRPKDKAKLVQYVTTPFAASQQPLVQLACCEAADCVLELVAQFKA